MTTFDDHDDPPPDDARVVDDGLEASNRAAAPLHEVRKLASFARDADGTVIGGAVGRTWGACCELQQLWVSPPLRGRGIARDLVRRFEARAATRGCTFFYLETWSFQAPGLYAKLGYRSTLAFDGYGPGLVKHVMAKTFVRGADAPAASAIDHIVLTVADLARTIDFYERALGMRAVTFGQGRRGLAFGRQKINLHVAGREFVPHARVPQPGSADFCLIVPGPLDDAIARLAAAGVPVELGPVEKIGATGPLSSVYVRDPDGNLVEIAEPRWAAG
jgi:catechol 2,3-dioxygenase-like lactoylglutathione lyase family enzyme/GNAT superfamily N-acetyltransferase